MHGRTFDDAAAHARHLAQTEGLEYIAPFDDRWVIAGQGTIGLELIQQDAALTHVFVPVGGGGLAAGIAVVIKQLMPQVQVIAVEPEDSAVLSGKAPGPHKIQGIGAGFVPDTLDTKIYDEIITVSNADAFATGRRIGKEEGVLTGISSGAAVHAAIQIAKRPEAKGKNIVIILPDSGDRYLSSPLFADEA